MSAKFRLGSVVVAFLTLLGPGLSLAQTPAACPADATALTDGAKLKCTCDATASGGVYGSVRYTADSSICQAAKHAGKAPGPVDLAVGGACPSFSGSSANGVTTANWSSYDKTFSFGDSLAPCSAATAAPPPATSTPAAAGQVANCPSFITQSDKTKPGESLTCICDKALDLQVGAAYGADRYSNDSPICVAARHAGKLPEPGGTVTVYVAEGCGKFEGSARNGITTRSWSSSVPGTISFVTPAPGLCRTAGCRGTVDDRRRASPGSARRTKPAHRLGSARQDLRTIPAGAAARVESRRQKERGQSSQSVRRGDRIG